MDKIKEMIDKVVDKIKKDPDFAKKFQSEPVKALESVLDVDLTDDQINEVIAAVKTKIKLDKLDDSKIVGKLKDLFK